MCWQINNRQLIVDKHNWCFIRLWRWFILDNDMQTRMMNIDHFPQLAFFCSVALDVVLFCLIGGHFQMRYFGITLRFLYFYSIICLKIEPFWMVESAIKWAPKIESQYDTSQAERDQVKWNEQKSCQCQHSVRVSVIRWLSACGCHSKLNEKSSLSIKEHLRVMWAQRSIQSE